MHQTGHIECRKITASFSTFQNEKRYIVSKFEGFHMQCPNTPPILIDCQYTYPQYAASYLLTETIGTATEAIFVENNTTHAVPLLLDCLKQQGLTPDDVKYLIIT